MLLFFAPKKSNQTAPAGACSEQPGEARRLCPLGAWRVAKRPPLASGTASGGRAALLRCGAQPSRGSANKCGESSE